MQGKEQHQGILAIVAANVIFGLNIPVTKSLMTEWMTPMGYTVTRMFFGTLIFWGIGSFLKQEKVKGKDLLIIILGGLLGFLGTQLLFSQSLKYTTPVVFALLIALTPVVVLLLSAIFLNEIIPKRKIIGVIISIIGAAIIILSSKTEGEMASNNSLGILFAVLCVFSYAIYLVLTRKISIKYKPITIAKWMFLFSAIAAIPFSFSELPIQKIYSSESTILAFSLLAFALLFSTTLAFFLMPVALKKLEASTVSVFMNLQPIVASVVAIAVGQDTFTIDKPLAALLVLTGVYLVSTKGFRYKVKRV
jgi:drug/metabolite transporter (DMT)-like permease